ncbi:hypothetical protein ABH925_005385 [Streptacidiphilus sp. EB129]
MRVRSWTVLVIAGLGVGGLGGFLGGLIHDCSRRNAELPLSGLSWSKDTEVTTAEVKSTEKMIAEKMTAESRGSVHGTQARTADSRLAH